MDLEFNPTEADPKVRLNFFSLFFQETIASLKNMSLLL